VQAITGHELSATMPSGPGKVKRNPLNNVLKCTDTQGPYTCNWAVPSQRNVTYTIRARAYDGSNNTNDATVTVTAR
jgi:hypothetical protein